MYNVKPRLVSTVCDVPGQVQHVLMARLDATVYILLRLNERVYIMLRLNEMFLIFRLDATVYNGQAILNGLYCSG